MPFATVPDGTRLYYETLGAGDSLLLVAGLANDHHAWDTVRDAFAEHYQVIVFDHRGVGQSDKPEQPPYSTRGFAQDAVSLLDTIGIERAHAYGFSMGGRVLQWFGIDHPHRVGALVLACTTPGNAHGIPRTAANHELFVRNAYDPEAQKAFMEMMFSPQYIASHTDQLMEMARLAIEYPVPEYARNLHVQASESHDSWELLPTIQAPTLVIHGSQDVVNPTANAPLLAGRIPNAELTIVQGGRHGFFVEYAEEVNRVILDFLERHPLQN